MLEDGRIILFARRRNCPIATEMDVCPSVMQVPDIQLNRIPPEDTLLAHKLVE